MLMRSVTISNFYTLWSITKEPNYFCLKDFTVTNEEHA